MFFYRLEGKELLTEFSGADDKLHRSFEVIAVHDFGLWVLLLKLVKLLLELSVVMEGQTVVSPEAPGARVVVRLLAAVVESQVQWEASDRKNSRHQQVCRAKLDQFLKQNKMSVSLSKFTYVHARFSLHSRSVQNYF